MFDLDQTGGGGLACGAGAFWVRPAGREAAGENLLVLDARY